jgi:predicted HTH transcriptional regulator
MLFRDRLEILNPGTLPFGLSLSQLSKEHSSVPTNPILANPVYLAGYIERLGTGTTDIVSLCEQDGLPTPQFAQDAFFKVTIYRKLKSAESNNDKLGQSNKEENAENTFVNNAFGCIHSGIDSKQSNKESNIDSNIGNIESNIDSLTYQQQTVINFCYVPRTSTEIFQRLGLTRQTKNIKTYITDLVAMGFLRMIDPEHPRSKNQKYIKV